MLHGDPTPGRDPRTTALRERIRGVLRLDADTAVVVRQLARTEPDRPTLETVVAVLPMSGAPRRWTLHRPVAEITEDDLQSLRVRTPEGD
ncbi:hypothetical protein [Streptomyces sp. NPDC002851]